MTLLHEKAFVLKYTGLQAVSSFLSENHENAKDTMSHALSPVGQHPCASVQVDWNVDFKSGWVARNVIQKLSKEEDTVIRQQIHFYFKKFRMHEDWRDDCFRLSEDPQNYCDPQERTLGGTFAKGEKGVKAAQVQVCYLLVVPKATPKYVSDGWSENRTRTDHIGEVYCLLLLGGPSLGMFYHYQDCI